MHRLCVTIVLLVLGVAGYWGIRRATRTTCQPPAGLMHWSVLCDGVKNFHADYRRNPPQEPHDFIPAMRGKGDSRDNPRGRDYLGSIDGRQFNGDVMMDAWGREYRITSSAEGWYFHSAGMDGVFENAPSKDHDDGGFFVPAVKS